MDKQLYDILDGLTADEMMSAAELLEDMAENCTLSEAENNRILSSVMGKAGFEMDNNIRPKKARKHKIRLTGLIAAAVIGVGAIGAGAYSYSNRVWNVVSDYFFVEDEDPHEMMENLKSVTENFDGQILENTFTGLDFIFEGTVNDSENGYVILTVKRSNGEPFEFGEDGCIETGYYRESPQITGGNYDTVLYPYYMPCYGDTINDDGSVTMMIRISNEALFHKPYYKPDLVDGDESIISGEYVLSFSNRYVFNDPDICMAMHNDKEIMQCNSDMQIIDGRNDPEKREQAMKSKLARCAEYATKCYEGTLTFTVDMSDDHSTYVKKIDGDTTVEVWLSSVSVRTLISNEKGIDYYKEYDKDSFYNPVREIPIEVHFMDGTVIDDATGWGYGGVNREYFGDDEEHPTSIRRGNGFAKPIDTSEVDYVMVDGHKVEF